MNASTLRELAAMPGALRLVGEEHVCVRGVTSDSRRVEPGDLFAALAGRTVDGTTFINEAAARGASAVLAQREASTSLPTLLVDDVRRQLGPIAHRIYGDPTRTLRTVGVTGTNGKTTVTHLLESVLLEASLRPALLGTIAQRGPQGEVPSELTTPEADRLARFARDSLAAGATHLVLEVSSVALREERVRGMHFAVAAFTNLSHDHLDYHGTLEAYGEQKARLFTEYTPAASVIVVDQPFGAALAARAAGRVWTCSVKGDSAALSIKSAQFGAHGLEAEIATPSGTLQCESPLFGRHNLENLLVTVGCALALGLDLPTIGRALKRANGAPGRLERVFDSRGVLVLVDYAHTPDALERALAALRPLTKGRLFAVFGCGGDRDRTKRAPMAEKAALGADLAVLTSDNPRSEDPAHILREMEPGASAHLPRIEPAELAASSRGYTLIVDRAQAIAEALGAARTGDTVLIAGKGHETYQVIGAKKHAFDDRVEAARAIAELGGG